MYEEPVSDIYFGPTDFPKAFGQLLSETLNRIRPQIVESIAKSMEQSSPFYRYFKNR